MSAWLRQKNWWNEVLWKPKKSLSLEQLKCVFDVILAGSVDLVVYMSLFVVCGSELAVVTVCVPVCVVCQP